MDGQTRKPLPRIRTLPEAFKMLKAEDPGTAVSMRQLRQIAPSLPGSIRKGRWWMINYDNLLDYLADPDREERDRLREYEEARSKIRPVPSIL